MSNQSKSIAQEEMLKTKSLAELKKIKKSAEKSKHELETKKKSGEEFTEENQNDLDEVTLFIVDVDEEIENRELEGTEQEAAKESYDKDSVVLEMINGRRYNSFTGEEESYPFVQTFSRHEAELFLANHKTLGYFITKVINDPYGIAKVDITTK